ncbi:KH domain-containing protein [Streptomyces sp. NPDC001812]|uniref:KH domain-containing protein n=1 Tax=Streptomyces cathayae TaxID=3031124 RepID=A0ABY8JYW7_9ACTN|nr:KH domain-containing protein [Streptomyces sp. HUAS 5]WGD39866.1 KH domain-containing protein [Streptomyces sp. HUAS 5]
MTTAPSAAVPVMLDLRAHLRPPASPDGYVEMWNRLEPVLVTLDPRSGPRICLDMAEEGTVTVLFLSPATAPVPFSANTPFAVRGILEPPRVRYSCATCRREGATTYAPFTCTGCGSDERPGRVCDAHAVFLDGSLRTSCAEHVPVCRCGRTARAWCGGPRCRSGRAWCSDHLVRHRGDASVEYCLECHEERFPACERSGCTGTGLTRCEHRDPNDGKPCDRRMCAEHVTRWRIYGDRSPGLALCARHHGGLRTASPDTLVALILMGTAARAQSRRGSRQGSRRSAFLPRIGIVRHIFINTCNRVLDMGTLDSLFVQLQRDLQHRKAVAGGRGLTEAALRLLDQHAASRREDVQRFRDSHTEGKEHFARLRALLQQSGKYELADAITFADYRPKSGILFVRVPQEMRSRFIGSGGAVVKDLRARLGVNIQLERE